MLPGPHLSVLRNPRIAEVFRRVGAIEAWGSGTNRVIEECIAYGIEPPKFEEWGNAIVVTFRAAIGPDALSAEPAEDHVGTKLGPSRDQVGTKSEPSRDQAEILEMAREAKSVAELMAHFGRTNRTKFRDDVLVPLMTSGWLGMTIPDKPRSSKQRYCTTEAGLRLLDQARR